MMRDEATPTFSGMILGWLDGLKTTEQIEFMKRVGVPHDRREEYLKALSGDPVVSLPQPAQRAITSSLPIIQHVDITPTMAMEGAPGRPNRPMPQPGSDLLAKPTIDLSKRS